MQTAVVRAGERKDISFLTDCNYVMAMETESKQLDREVLARGVTGVFEDPSRGFYLVAENGDQRAGCLMVTKEWSDWRAGEFWWIQSVFVKAEHRRKGVYRRLFEEVQKRAQNAPNVCGIRLYVERSNFEAKKTYEALGMSESNYLLFE